MARVSLISLGCPRNLVDSEVMLGFLRKAGYTVWEDATRCDAVVVNTCSFIEDAKRESIDLILQVVELKKQKRIKAIVVAGCLPQRYPSQLREELREVDGFLGTDDYPLIAQAVKRALAGEKFFGSFKRPTFLYDHTHRRELITPKHFAYLKLAEGCDNNCSYCVIPAIRGRLRSRGIDSLMREAKQLFDAHRISEINLIGQDITLYGKDLYGRPRLAELLKKLANLTKAHWIRLLYTHPEHYTDELIRVIRDTPSICKYLDVPLQHISDRILRLMNRKVRKKDIIRLIERFRDRIPGVAIRTTFIVGFPQETEADFKELIECIGQMKFERLGVFQYSREEGTAACRFVGQLPEKIKQERFDAIMKLQQDISREVNGKFLGREIEVLIDEPSELNKRNQLYNSIGRTQYDAPEVDGNCFVRSRKRHRPGDFVRARIVDTLEYDLVGEEA